MQVMSQHPPVTLEELAAVEKIGQSKVSAIYY